MPWIVPLEFSETVADVQEGIAVETNVHESGLHAGEDAGDFSFVDAADERDFFFPLDVDFDYLAFFENRDPPFVGGRGDNQFFRHENSLCVTPAWPESPFCAAPAWPGLTGRIAASFCPSEFPKIGAAPGNAGTHVGHTCREVAWRSKPEGLAALRPLSEKTFLSLSRLVRRRKRAGRSADDAVLTLKSFLLVTPAEPGSAIPNANSIPVRSGGAGTSHGTGGLVS